MITKELVKELRAIEYGEGEFPLPDTMIDDIIKKLEEREVLIKASFNPKNKSLGKLAEDLGVSFSAAKIISDHAQPEITEELIEEKVRELYEMCSYADRIHGFMYTIPISKAKDFIRSFVEEIQGK